MSFLLYQYQQFYFFLIDSVLVLLLLLVFFAASIALASMFISFGMRLSWLVNLLLSSLIEYFFFTSQVFFINYSIQFVVVSKYFFNPRVVALSVNCCWIKPLPPFSLLT